jgi:uncharacterized protein (TIGR04255 family)
MLETRRLMLNVPDVPQYRMTAAPLVQAIVQVNYPVVARLQRIEGIEPMQDALGDMFPYMARNHVQEVSMNVGPAGPTAESTQSIVNEFTNDDGWALSVSVNSASLSVDSRYLGIEDFAHRFDTVCRALSGAGGVKRCERLGVRYLDFVDADEGTDAWATWFRPELVGLANPSLSSPWLRASLTETRLHQRAEGVLSNTNAFVDGVIRYGIVPPGAVMTGVPPRPVEHRTFIFDMDIYVATAQPMSADVLVPQFRALHGSLERVFHWAVTEAGRANFGYELIEGTRD